jgi:GntR family transcriptional regulator of vanillate catabolism
MRKMEQGTRALITLREMILSGALPGGERLRELALVETLKISRTPIRYALAKLADEGLLENVGGGFAVREFSTQEIRDAIRLRGAVEGMAARTAAEKGPALQVLPLAWQCIDELDVVLGARSIRPTHIERYLDINLRFHGHLAQMSDSFVLQRTINHVCALPFASPNAFVMARRDSEDIRHVMMISQQQHRTILEAIENRDGARAEAITREHAELSLSAARRVFDTPDQAERVPALNLLAENDG